MKEFLAFAVAWWLFWLFPIGIFWFAFGPYAKWRERKLREWRRKGMI